MEHAPAQIAAALLSIVFAWSAVAKIVRLSTWRSIVPRYRLPKGLDTASIVGVPLIEGVVPVLFILGASRAGAAFALGLLSAFSLAVLRARRLEGDRLPCGCFGKTTTRDYRATIARNGLLGMTAGVVLLAGRDVGLLAGLGAPSASELAAVLLVILGLVLIAWMLRSAGTSLRGGRS